MLYDHTLNLEGAATLAVSDILACGTPVIFNGPVGSAWYGKEKPGDYDVLVLVPKDTLLEGLAERMASRLWTDCASDIGATSAGDPAGSDYYNTWIALRSGPFNAIITNDYVWCMRMRAASALVKQIATERYEVLEKEEVITIFRAIREGQT